MCFLLVGDTAAPIEHMHMKELHTAMPQTACPGSSSLTDPHHRVQAQPPRFASRLLCELVVDIVGAQTPNPPLEDQHSKDYAMNIVSLIHVINL